MMGLRGYRSPCLQSGTGPPPPPLKFITGHLYIEDRYWKSLQFATKSGILPVEVTASFKPITRSGAGYYKDRTFKFQFFKNVGGGDVLYTLVDVK